MKDTSVFDVVYSVCWMNRQDCYAESVTEKASSGVEYRLVMGRRCLELRCYELKNILLKGAFFSDFICIFVMLIVPFRTLLSNDKQGNFYDVAKSS